jgi:hypothetical protein
MSDASLPHCEMCNEPEYACICEDREARLKELMGDLLFTIKEYSEKNERPDEILFVLDRITHAYRSAFDSATDQRIQWPERPRGNGAKLPD